MIELFRLAAELQEICQRQQWPSEWKKEICTCHAP
jgi:hypothetical protein